MSISAIERELRVSAAQSALASVRIAGGEPSQLLRTLLAAWSGRRRNPGIRPRLAHGAIEVKEMIDETDFAIPGTATLRNKLGITDPSLLKDAEAGAA